MDVKGLLALMREKAKQISDVADFMDSYNQSELSAWFRYAQSSVLRIMDVIENYNYKKLDDVEELLDAMSVDCSDNAVMFKDKGYQKFSELALIDFCVIESVREDIERNK